MRYSENYKLKKNVKLFIYSFFFFKSFIYLFFFKKKKYVIRIKQFTGDGCHTRLDSVVFFFKVKKEYI